MQTTQHWVPVIHDAAEQQGLLQQAQRLQEFSQWLLRVGDGSEPAPLRIPADMCAPAGHKVEELCDTIFGDVDLPAARTAAALLARGVLTQKNDNVDSINGIMHDRWPGRSWTYLSADSVTAEDEQAMAYPMEFLNSLLPAGIPPHQLKLKEGMPIMLLRNLSTTMGLANGTRLLIQRLGQRVIQAEILTGHAAGNQCLIPRINFTTSEAEKLPFNLTRRQFPVRPAFAMTINKAQGQTFQRVGVYLPDVCFSHGHLYVALSRSGDPSNITVLATHQRPATAPTADGVYTENVVYGEVFQGNGPVPAAPAPAVQDPADQQDPYQLEDQPPVWDNY